MHRNKLTLVLLFTLLCSLTLQGQKKFRPSLNLSGADEELWNFGLMFGFNQFDTSQDFPEGLNIRFTAERNLKERLDFRLEPGIIFEKEPIDKNEAAFTEIQFPLLLKYSANRLSNMNPFILGGYHPVYRLHDATSSTKNTLVHYVEAGFGFDFYLRKSKASLHLRVIKDISRIRPEIINTSGVFIGLSVETRDGWKLYKQ